MYENSLVNTFIGQLDIYPGVPKECEIKTQSMKEYLKINSTAAIFLKHDNREHFLNNFEIGVNEVQIDIQCNDIDGNYHTQPVIVFKMCTCMCVCGGGGGGCVCVGGLFYVLPHVLFLFSFLFFFLFLFKIFHVT